MKNIVFISVLCIFANIVIANEGSISMAGGSVSVFKGENPYVSLDSEYVYITLDTNQYYVDAHFFFFNSGQTITLPVGFPNYGYNSNIKPLINFESWVNGKKIEYIYKTGYYIDEEQTGPKADFEKRYPSKSGYPSLSSPLLNGIYPVDWYLKNIVFKAKSTSTTRVQYTAKMGYPGIAGYLYGTGRTWKGKIKKTVFRITNSPFLSITHIGFRERNQSPVLRLNDSSFQLEITDYKPKLNEVIEIYTYDKPDIWESPEDTYPPIDKRYFESKLTQELLKYFSLKQLRYLRNAFYARHGKVFLDPELNEYFVSRSWYTPNTEYSDTLLSDIERENIDFIVKYETDLKRSFIK
jgi:hypothetical protein